MKITMVAVTSRDGFINHLNERQAFNWTSDEDKIHSATILKQFDLHIMGRNTYEAYLGKININLQKRRVVFTRQPENFTGIPDRLEFTNEDLPFALARLEQEGFINGLLLGGGEIYTQFLQAGLVDEALITIEPITFGEGIPFLKDGHTIQDFKNLILVKESVLNQNGTRLLHFLRK